MTNGGDSGVQLLAQFFRELAENHELYNNYLTDPLQTMRAYGIPEDLIGAVLQGDLRHLNRRFAEEFAGLDQADSGGATFLFGTIIHW
jgi:hypothetical protein